MSDHYARDTGSADEPCVHGDAAAGSGSPRIPEEEVRQRLANSSAVIIGCGGLGSNIAAMLLRSGVRTLRLIDFDVVEESNLNRQLFFQDQIGRPKVDALVETLRRIDPDARLEPLKLCVTADNLCDLVEGFDVVVEAVDTVEAKALIVGICAVEAGGPPLVAASGLAGYDSANLIRTQQLGESIWVAGDFSADSTQGHALLGSRVMVAAAHQAHAVIRLHLGLAPQGDEP